MRILKVRHMGSVRARGEWWWDVEIALDGAIAGEEELRDFAVAQRFAPELGLDVRRSGLLEGNPAVAWIQGPEVRRNRPDQLPASVRRSS